MTAPNLELELEADATSGLVRFRLRDAEGRHLGAHQVRIGTGPPALWEGIFDTRSHVDRYQGGTRFTDRPATAEDLLPALERGGIRFRTGSIHGVLPSLRP